jgi:hypothetical protein
MIEVLRKLTFPYHDLPVFNDASWLLTHSFGEEVSQGSRIIGSQAVMRTLRSDLALVALRVGR